MSTLQPSRRLRLAGKTTTRSKFFNRVYEVVRRIPMGQVTTYGEVARVLMTRDARRVGHALHANRDPGVPCHRVVDRSGRLAPNFAFDGVTEQRRRLQSEGVRFRDEMHVDLAKHMLRFDRK